MQRFVAARAICSLRRLRRVRGALALTLICASTACEAPVGDSCDYTQAVMLTLSPRKGEGVLDDQTTDLPAFAAPQGLPASEVDLLLTGMDPEDISSIRVRVAVEDLGLISDTLYSPLSIGYVCDKGGGIFVDDLPVNYGAPVMLVEELEGLSGMISVEVSGVDELTRSFPVVMRVDSY